MAVDGWRQAQLGWFIEPYMFDSPTKGGPALFDNSFMSAEVLRSFYRAHHDVLSTIPVSDVNSVFSKYRPQLDIFREAWDRSKTLAQKNANFIEIRKLIEDRDNFEEEDELDADILASFDYEKFELKTLKDLVLLGLFYRDFAGSAAMDLISQLKKLETHKTLFLVDTYNAWEVPSVYQYENEVVMPKQLCVPYSLNFLSRHRADMNKWDHKNGLAIGFTSFKHPEAKDVYKDTLQSFHLSIKMPVYSSTEYLAAMKLYLEHSNIYEDDITSHDIICFRMFCASNPRLVRIDGVSFFLPVSAEREALTEDPFDDALPAEFSDKGDYDGADGDNAGIDDTLSDEDKEALMLDDDDDDNLDNIKF